MSATDDDDVLGYSEHLDMIESLHRATPGEPDFAALAATFGIVLTDWQVRHARAVFHGQRVTLANGRDATLRLLRRIADIHPEGNAQ